MCLVDSRFTWWLCIGALPRVVSALALCSGASASCGHSNKSLQNRWLRAPHIHPPTSGGQKFDCAPSQGSGEKLSHPLSVPGICRLSWDCGCLNTVSSCLSLLLKGQLIVQVTVLQLWQSSWAGCIFGSGSEVQGRDANKSWRQLVTLYIVRKQRKADAGVKSTFSLRFSLGLQATEWCHPHSGWVLPPPLT